MLKVTYLTENADLNPDLSGFVLVSLDFKLHEGRDVKKKKKKTELYKLNGSELVPVQQR